MTNRELARLLLLYPERPACVMSGGILREVERVRVAESAYLPREEDGLVARGQVIVCEPLQESGESAGAVRSTTASPAADL